MLKWAIANQHYRWLKIVKSKRNLKQTKGQVFQSWAKIVIWDYEASPAGLKDSWRLQCCWSQHIAVERNIHQFSWFHHLQTCDISEVPSTRTIIPSQPDNFHQTFYEIAKSTNGSPWIYNFQIPRTTQTNGLKKWLMKVRQIGPTFLVHGKMGIFWGVKSFAPSSTLKMRNRVNEKNLSQIVIKAIWMFDLLNHLHCGSKMNQVSWDCI